MRLHTFLFSDKFSAKVWEKFVVKPKGGGVCRSFLKLFLQFELDVNPSSTLLENISPFLVLPSPAVTTCFVFVSASLLPAWGRSMHVPYSGSVPFSCSSPPYLHPFISTLFFALIHKWAAMPYLQFIRSSSWRKRSPVKFLWFVSAMLFLREPSV